MATALITGASTGIGREIARLFARDGHDLILVARDAARLDRVAAELEAISGRAAKVLPADLPLPYAPEEIYGEAQSANVEFLINNAGFGLQGPFSETDLQAELQLIQVNVTAVVHLTKLLVKDMAARRRGRILNVASTAAFQPGPFMALYYASKAFVLSFSEALSEEMRGSGVTVTALCPGPTETEFMKRAGIEHTALGSGRALGMKSAAEVALAGYKGMMRGRPLVIPGAMNRMGVQLLRIAPRAMVRRMVRRIQEKKA